MLLAQRKGTTLGCTLLICGITIGVGMLGLPVATASAGFWPSLIAYFLCWIFMMATGWLMLEACQHLPKESNYISITRHLLGKGASALCWALYLFLLICLMVAHMAAAGQIIGIAAGEHLLYWQGVALFVVVLWPVIGVGAALVDRINLLLMVALLLTFLLFVISTVGHVNTKLLAYRQWSQSLSAIPIIFTAFGYQILIPSLLSYAHGNVRVVRRAIFWGTAIPLAIYIVWQFLISGIVPQELLKSARLNGVSAVTPLSDLLHHPFLQTVGNLFALLTLTTSYLGITLGFVDFLADGLKLSRRGLPRFWICCAIFLLPAAISLVDPALFLTALGVAGGYGVALLSGLLPIAMIWNVRYGKRANKIPYQLAGGKAMLLIMLAFTLLVVLLETI